MQRTQAPKTYILSDDFLVWSFSVHGGTSSLPFSNAAASVFAQSSQAAILPSFFVKAVQQSVGPIDC